MRGLEVKLSSRSFLHVDINLYLLVVLVNMCLTCPINVGHLASEFKGASFYFSSLHPQRLPPVELLLNSDGT